LAFLPPELPRRPLHSYRDQPRLFDSPHLAAQIDWSLLQEQEPNFVHALFSSIAGRYDLTNHLLSGGLDFLWRARATEIVTGWKPETLLDLATGSGDLALAIQRTSSATRVTGADFCEPMLRRANQKGLANTVVADALNLPFSEGSFDAVTVAFGLRNMESWTGALREMFRVLTPGGHLLVLDFSLPAAPWRTPYRFYLHHVLPVTAGFVTGKREAYKYLGESIERFPAGSAMLSLIAGVGFAGATCEPLSAGIVSLYTAVKTDQAT
jgi:demethylmenaquinone methyltransferase/2-methoxy-6-polyprenyl-1,4-benzoquinol methylase